MPERKEALAVLAVLENKGPLADNNDDDECLQASKEPEKPTASTRRTVKGNYMLSRREVIV